MCCVAIDELATTFKDELFVKTSSEKWSHRENAKKIINKPQRIREKIIAKDAKVFLLRGSNNRTPIMTCRTGYPYSAFRDILSAFFHIRFYGMIDRLINNSDADDEF